MGLILQARMSSNRLPGKVLMRVGDKPMLLHVVERCRLAYPNGPVIVCTSDETSDDAIADFCKSKRIDVFRGALNDVYTRYIMCIKYFGLSVFGRVCCDSPGISPDLIQLAMHTYDHAQSADLVSNVCIRSFPPGQSIEIVNAETFRDKSFQKSAGFSMEHVTQTFYKDPSSYNIINIKHTCEMQTTNWAIDEPDDLHRVTGLIQDPFHYDEASIVIDHWAG